MALITCPDCKKQISDSATACIFCGKLMSNIEIKKILISLIGKKIHISKYPIVIYKNNLSDLSAHSYYKIIKVNDNTFEYEEHGDTMYIDSPADPRWGDGTIRYRGSINDLKTSAVVPIDKIIRIE